MRHGEEHFENLAKRNLRGIIDNADGFRVSGCAAAHGFILRGAGRAAGVSCGGAAYAFYMLEKRLNAPEASAGQNDGLRTFILAERLVSCGVGKFHSAGSAA